ncbi:MAG: hypothetical protein KC442_10395, partial [Thermomicrobiales bacterium]|nr:hypothetical protein [Thermomicrobiales bacterium]
MTATEANATTAASPATSPAPAPDANLHYLVGDTIFLRGISSEDAKWGMAWWPSPFPAAVETLEDLIKKQIPQGMQ